MAGSAARRRRERRRGWGGGVSRAREQRVRADPTRGCGWKMAELRVLVAVKRVIDFAVKVTGPPSPTSLRPAARCFRDHEHTLYNL